MNREKGKNGSYVCPCCGYATLDEVANYEICELCFWEDDGQDDIDAHECLGGPNHVSLTEARKNFLEFGAAEKKDLSCVRSVRPTDENVRNYKLINGEACAN